MQITENFGDRFLVFPSSPEEQGNAGADCYEVEDEQYSCDELPHLLLDSRHGGKSMPADARRCPPMLADPGQGLRPALSRRALRSDTRDAARAEPGPAMGVHGDNSGLLA